MTLNSGQSLLGRYQIKALLGEGGMGAVYQAFDTFSDESCAVKEFRLGYLPSEHDTQLQPGQDATHDRRVKTPPITREAAASKFEQEAKLLSRLDHPNLPKVTNYFQMEGNYYLVMTLVEGQDLRKKLDQAVEPLPEQQVLAWMTQVMDALEYIHGQVPPIIHRDIKPANIVVDANEQAFLVDFGIAKPFVAESHRSAVPITTGFSPIEQYGNTGRTDIRSDIYSLGASLYTLLTGNEPTSAIDRVSGEKLVPPRQLVPEISPALDESIVRALSISPDDRFRSVAEMRATIQAAGTMASTAASSTGARPAQTAASKLAPSQKRARHLLVTCALLVVVASCIMTTMWLANATNRSEPPSPTPTTEASTTEMGDTSFTSTPTIVIPVETDRTVLLGPVDIGLQHQPANGQVETYDTELNLSDFVVQARFDNPYGGGDFDWDYGFGFRVTDDGGYRIYVDSLGTWYLVDSRLESGSWQFTTVMSGTLTDLSTIDDGSNLIRLEVNRDRGWLRVNNQLVAQMDLPAHTAPGKLWVGTGLVGRHELEGKTTGINELVVWAPATFRQMTATAEALSTVVPQVYALAEGRLEHTDPRTTQRVAIRLARVKLRNLVVQARFFNPYDTAVGKWDYGFGFRVRGSDNEYRFYVNSDNQWAIQLVKSLAKGVSATAVADGQLTNLDITPTGSNILRLVVTDDRAEVYVNDTYIATADVSEENAAGDVWIGTGLIDGHMVAGEVTRFEEFFISSLLDEGEATSATVTPVATASSTTTVSPAVVLAPTNGVLTHELENTVATYSRRVSMRDFTMQVRFHNPYEVSEGAWDFGVAFRTIAPDNGYRLIVQSNRMWYFGRVTPSQGTVSFSIIAQGRVPDLGVASSMTNLLRLEVNGDQGQFFLNGDLVASLDTSALKEQGEVYIGAGFIEDNKLAGKSTRFEDFTIWAPPVITEATATALATSSP